VVYLFKHFNQNNLEKQREKREKCFKKVVNLPVWLNNNCCKGILTTPRGTSDASGS
jgi:hypothetical protein